MTITGIIVYEDLEGGFWGIVGTDGARFEVENSLPADIKQPGTMVEAEVEPTGSITIRQWGTPVKVLSAKAV